MPQGGMCHRKECATGWNVPHVVMCHRAERPYRNRGHLLNISPAAVLIGVLLLIT